MIIIILLAVLICTCTCKYNPILHIVHVHVPVNVDMVPEIETSTGYDGTTKLHLDVSDLPFHIPCDDRSHTQPLSGMCVLHSLYTCIVYIFLHPPPSPKFNSL